MLRDCGMLTICQRSVGGGEGNIQKDWYVSDVVLQNQVRDFSVTDKEN